MKNEEINRNNKAEAKKDIAQNQEEKLNKIIKKAKGKR